MAWVEECCSLHVESVCVGAQLVKLIGLRFGVPVPVLGVVHRHGLVLFVEDDEVRAPSSAGSVRWLEGLGVSEIENG
ncbi:hypothetical protein OG994_11785 [Micromonospora globbae]|uniref:Uncharacterized protein n=1 Tax=Micromonospora globbae TaxID=1894969 RepID=A0ABZ1SCA5_9ACTN|nr:hypothetical protein [Micromonospora globbae]